MCVFCSVAGELLVCSFRSFAVMPVDKYSILCKQILQLAMVSHNYTLCACVLCFVLCYVLYYVLCYVLHIFYVVYDLDLLNLSIIRGTKSSRYYLIWVPTVLK